MNSEQLSPSSILIIDDTPQNIDIIVESLSSDYEICVATNGIEALESAEEILPDLILLDIMMPEMDGFQTIKELKKNPKTRDIPVIFLTALSEIEEKAKGFNLGAVDYMTKPFNIQEVQLRVETHLSAKLGRDILMKKNITLESLVAKRTEQILKTQDITIRMAASLAETRDNETGNHIIRTQRYVEVLARAYNEVHNIDDERTISLLVKSAPLHDIGKIGIPDAVLLKPGKLEKDEFDIMKTHTSIGDEALEKAEKENGRSSFLNLAREIALNHHEKWDGSGYPNGLKGEKIPMSGRIMAIADVYDALISKRVYKAPFTHSKAVSIIEEGHGTHFEPELCTLFLQIHEDFRSIALELAESDEVKEALAR
ncbi:MULTISPECIES: two-component system response regulator [unclassified Oceanispirochaeta]|uniref:response regulator n=1 Tax=unclassified Oceanispirochaeta TaxID=2635722 RepID=UPI000E097120|nr:two-component system response regulator [Oceanispirochaeta sp. M1]MBF9014794.1 two-component system response regulator [Oceanispirochaeta sp. M2]NPD71050.1 two-component system response regulator [Oceanispirochaeta sp. M1]RDG33883.1 response regulator [Oceanispirochaeta sp. M1]